LWGYSSGKPGEAGICDVLIGPPDSRHLRLAAEGVEKRQLSDLLLPARSSHSRSPSDLRLAEPYVLVM